MLQLDLEEERRQHQEELESYKNEIKKTESTLLNRLEAERRSLLEERKKVECALRQEMELKLIAKGHALEEPLLKERECLNRILEEKDKERQEMELKLNEERLKNDQQNKDELSRVKNNILSSMADVIETELQCSICNELFVQVTYFYLVLIYKIIVLPVLHISQA